MEKENHYVSISCGRQCFFTESVRNITHHLRDVPQDGLPGSLDFMAFMRQGTKNSFSPHGCLLFGLVRFVVFLSGK